MASRRRIPPAPSSKSVSGERKLRLLRLVRLLGAGPQTLSALTRRLHLDVRGFYRDLELLRHVGVRVSLQEQRYKLEDKLKDALERLPVPDPELTLGEARQLATGRTPAHRKLRDQIRRFVR